MITSEQVDKVLPALFNLKKKLKPMTKDANNPFFKSKYLELPDLLENLEPLLIEDGLLLSQGNVHRHGDEYVVSRLSHAASGQFVESEYKIGFTSNPQANAGASTYARRYSLKGLLAIAEVDDDGNTASGKPQQYKAAAQSPAKPTSPLPPASKPAVGGFAAAAKSNPAAEIKPPDKPVIKAAARSGSFGN